MVHIEQAWENDRSSFTEIPKAEFDALVRANRFALGPLRTDLSRWMKEFGPYSPERWAFGETDEGKRICTKVT